MPNKKNLLIYAHYYIPDTASTGQILRELAEGMLDKFNITVICVVPSYLGIIEDKYTTQKYYEEEINGVKVLRIRVPEFSKTNKKSRVKNIVSYFLGAMSATCKVGKQDYVFSISQPPILGGLLGVWGKWVKHAKFIYNIQDFNPEQVLAVGYTKSKFVTDAMMWFDKFSCKHSDLVITVGRDLVETMENRFKSKKVPNKLAWYELKEYYSTVKDYESHKQVMMKLTPHQRAKKKAHEEFVAAGGIEEIDEYDQPKDIIQITWERLPNMMPIFKQTLNDKKQFLSDIEIDELESIISEYKQIQSFIHRRILMSPMYYDVLNHPDENYLASIYPNDILKNMPAWIRKSLSSTESKKACERYVEVILSDFTMLSQYMENYEISQKGIDAYKDELDKAEAEVEPEDIDYDDVDFSEPEDEETFKRQNKIIDQQMEQEERPFTSWVISESCQKIAESIDVLEQSIMKKPYYGMMIKYFSN